jgi:hypothetical protein
LSIMAGDGACSNTDGILKRRSQDSPLTLPHRVS